MAIPNSKTTLAEYVLRRLGSPVIDINIAPEQIDDSIDDAISFFQEYSVDGSENRIIAQQVTATDVQNRYIETPPNVTGISRVYNPNRGRSGAFSSESLFDYQYHLYRNELFDLTKGAGGISAFYITEHHLATMEDAISFELRYRYNVHKNQLKVDCDWSRTFPEGSFVLYECYEKIDPEEWPDMYGNWVVRDLAVANAKKQWGMNISKFQEIQLPGGAILNGDRIMEEGKQEIEQIKSEFILKHQEPDFIRVG